MALRWHHHGGIKAAASSSANGEHGENGGANSEGK